MREFGESDIAEDVWEKLTDLFLYIRDSFEAATLKGTRSRDNYIYAIGGMDFREAFGFGKEHFMVPSQITSFTLCSLVANISHDCCFAFFLSMNGSPVDLAIP